MGHPIPGPRSLPFIGNTFEFRKNPPGYMNEVHNEYGDMAAIRAGWRKLILVFHPDQIREILVEKHKSFRKSRGLRLLGLLLGEGLLTLEGDAHRKHRKLIQPAFQKRRIDAYGVYIRKACNDVSAKWTDGQQIDVHRWMMYLALTIASRSLFNADVEDDAPEVGEALDRAMQDFNRVVSNPLGPLLVRLPTIAGRRFRSARKQLDRIVYGIIEERRKDNRDHGDFLSILFSKDENGMGLSPKQIRDEAMTIFLAGHETTANALSWSIYLLSRNPSFAERLRHELRAAPETIEPDTELPLTTALFSEAMRLYPPVWAFGRESIENVDVGGHSFARGTTFLLSPYVTHRDPRFWEAPNEFRPDRWLEDTSGQPRFRYFPFGGGPRICIGEPFAWMEGRMVLAQMLRMWDFQVDGATVRPKALVTLRPEGGIPARLVRL